MSISVALSSSPHNTVTNGHEVNTRTEKKVTEQILLSE